MPQGPDDIQTDGKDNNGDEDETMLFPPPYRVPDDPKGQNFGFERDGPDDDEPGHDEPVDDDEGSDVPGDGGDSPGVNGNPEDEGDKNGDGSDESSGFREEAGDRSDYEAQAESLDSGVIEQEIQQEELQLAENVPYNPGLLDLPSLYSTKKKDDGRIEDEDFFADVLAEARRGSEDAGGFQQSMGMENDGNDVIRSQGGADSTTGSDDVILSMKKESSGDYENIFDYEKEEGFDEYRMLPSAIGDNRLIVREQMISNEETEGQFQIDTLDEDDYERQRFERQIEDHNNLTHDIDGVGFNSREGFESSRIEESVLQRNVSMYEETLEKEGLSLPNLPRDDCVMTSGGIDSKDTTEYYKQSEIRRSSSSFTNLSKYDMFSETNERQLPASPSLVPVSLTKPVELTLPRKTFEALQSQSEREGLFMNNYNKRRGSIPVMVDGPFGKQMKEIRLTGVDTNGNERTMRRSSSSIHIDETTDQQNAMMLPTAPSSVRRTSSESDLLETHGKRNGGQDIRLNRNYEQNSLSIKRYRSGISDTFEKRNSKPKNMSLPDYSAHTALSLDTSNLLAKDQLKKQRVK